MHRPRTISRPRRGNAVGPILLRVLIMVGMWQGPLPWWHCHSGLAAACEECPVGLAEHLVDWHSASDVTATTSLGWHLHLGYFHPTDGKSRPTPAESQDRVSTGAAVGVEPPSLQKYVGPLLAAAAEFDRSTSLHVVDGRSTASHFYDGFAPSLPLPLRFGVARC